MSSLQKHVRGVLPVSIVDHTCLSADAVGPSFLAEGFALGGGIGDVIPNARPRIVGGVVLLHGTGLMSVSGALGARVVVGLRLIACVGSTVLVTGLICLEWGVCCAIHAVALQSLRIVHGSCA
jgi:hypothetical protein